METQNKNIIKAIADQTFDDNKSFGHTIADQYFHKDKRALLCVNWHYFFLLSNSLDATTEVKTLIELLSYLHYMENEHMIYVQKSESHADFIMYEDCNDMKKIATIQGYDLGCGYELKVEQGSYYVGMSDGRRVLSQCVNVDFLANEIIRYFESRIYPTAAVTNFIKHDYLSENDYNNRQALKISRRSVWVALAIACLSPFVTLWLSNQWGKATLNETQYDGLLLKIGENAIFKDTTAIMIRHIVDNPNGKEIDNEQDTFKPLQGE